MQHAYTIHPACTYTHTDTHTDTHKRTRACMHTHIHTQHLLTCNMPTLFLLDAHTHTIHLHIYTHKTLTYMQHAYIIPPACTYTHKHTFACTRTHNTLTRIHGIQVLRMPPYGLSPQKTADVFSTDPIRVLRAVRFASGFGLTVDQGVTKREVMKHAHRCKFDTPGAFVQP